MGMTEQQLRARVIAGLEWMAESHIGVEKRIADEALALLKAQEPRLVINIHKAYNNVLNPDVPWVGKCPKCGKRVSGKNLTRFCMYCGQAVKWE